MVAFTTNPYQITYGATVIGGTTENLIDGGYKIKRRSYTEFTVEFAVVIKEASEAALATAALALKDAFRLPDQRLLIEVDGNTIEDFDPATDSGFNQRGDVLKDESFADTALSRRYIVSIELELPADLAGRGGRRDSTIQLAYSESRRRTLTVDTTYTALGGVSAFDIYEANIDAYITSITTALGGTWELVVEDPIIRDDQNKTVTARQVWHDLIFNQSSAGLDDVDIKNQTLQITRGRVAPGDSDPSVRRFIEMEVNYEASINSELTTDLVSKWEGTILPFIMSKVQEVAGTSAVALVSSPPTFDFPNNRILARLKVFAVARGAKVLELRVTTEIRDITGYLLVAVWSGRKFDKHFMDGPARRIKTLTTQRRQLASGVGAVVPVAGGKGPRGAGGRAGGQFVSFSDVLNLVGGGIGGADQPEDRDAAKFRNKEGFIPLSTTVSSTPSTIGLDNFTVNVQDVNIVDVSEFRTVPPSSQNATVSGPGVRAFNPLSRADVLAARGG